MFLFSVSLVSLFPFLSLPYLSLPLLPCALLSSLQICLLEPKIDWCLVFSPSIFCFPGSKWSNLDVGETVRERLWQWRGRACVCVCVCVLCFSNTALKSAGLIFSHHWGVVLWLTLQSVSTCTDLLIQGVKHTTSGPFFLHATWNIMKRIM